MIFLYFLAAYGLCFFLQNKATFLHGKSAFTDKLLACTFCLGFHCGWISWLVASLVERKAVLGQTWLRLAEAGSPYAYGGVLASIILWSLAVSASCYVLDAIVRWFEVNSAE
jgi:hypothetical protein